MFVVEALVCWEILRRHVMILLLFDDGMVQSNRVIEA